MVFFRQGCWSVLPCSPPGDVPYPGIKSISLTLLHWQTGSLPSGPPEKPPICIYFFLSRFVTGCFQREQDTSLAPAFVFPPASGCLRLHGPESCGNEFTVFTTMKSSLLYPPNSKQKWGCSCCSVGNSCPTVRDRMHCSPPSSLSSTIAQSLLKFMSIESVMLSNHLNLSGPLLLLLSIFLSVRVFPNDVSFLFAANFTVLFSSWILTFEVLFL